MYKHILARDIKRKKSMNVILLIFIIMSATFIASSVNNIMSISNAIKNYFDKAELKDYYIVSISEEENNNKAISFLNSSELVKDYTIDDCYFLLTEDLTFGNNQKFENKNMQLVTSLEKSNQVYFDGNNEVISGVKENEIFIPVAVLENNDIKIGDTLTFHIGDNNRKLTIAGVVKDALLGSKLMESPRFIINNSVFNEAADGYKDKTGKIFAVSTNDTDGFERSFKDQEIDSVFASSIQRISMTYVLDMVIAAILLVVSIVLIIIAMVILKFTISFTLSEEFREIGIMKAIGIKSRKIRGLYIVKYLALSIIGSIIGLIVSIPFGSMLLDSVTRYMVIEDTSSSIILNCFSVIAVVLIIVLFCNFCTRRINKFSPLDAIRNGHIGERFKRKGLLRLCKSKLRTVFFMALNDILSSIKRFIVLIIVFTMGTLLMIIPINSINTISSPSTITMFGMTDDCNLYINDSDKSMDLMVSNHQATIDYLAEMKNKLSENGIAAEPFMETLFSATIEFGDNFTTASSYQGTNISADKYTYLEGVAPMLPNEIAVTKYTAEAIGAEIGDTITVSVGNITDEFIITATFQSMNNFGEGVRFSQSYDKLPYEKSIGNLSAQIKYTDNPDDKTINERIEKITELFPDCDISTPEEYSASFTGGIVSELDGARMLIVIVVILIDILVAVLMVKSFITKERGEIAMLKSLGFSNGSLMCWQTIRIGIIMLVSTILGALLSDPISQVSTAFIFKMMGATSVNFVVNPLEVFVFYPLVIFAATMIASIFAAAHLIRINAHETSGIE